MGECVNNFNDLYLLPCDNSIAQKKKIKSQDLWRLQCLRVQKTKTKSRDELSPIEEAQ